MRTIVITGSAGGIGAATRARLEKEGHRVIGVDVRDAEVIADLSTPAGRAAMVDAVGAACDGMLDGLVAGAGIMGEDAVGRGDQLLRRGRDPRRAAPAPAERSRPERGRDQLELDHDDTRAARRARRRAPRGRRGRLRSRSSALRRACSRTPRRSSRSRAGCGATRRARVDRCGHPPQRDRAGRDPHADDRERPRLHLLDSRRVPGADRAAGPPRGDRRAPRVPALARRGVLLRLGRVLRRRQRRRGARRRLPDRARRERIQTDGRRGSTARARHAVAARPERGRRAARAVGARRRWRPTRP